MFGLSTASLRAGCAFRIFVAVLLALIVVVALTGAAQALSTL